MSQRLYYTDAYTCQFTAQILEQGPQDKYTAVILDQSYFYPTSGGQPADSGTLAGMPVVDVYIRESDGAVVHLVETAAPISGKTARGEITWSRRFDHMQQHTGQHILSQAFIVTAEAETVGFHLSDQSCTIDLDNVDLTAAQVEQAEQLANQIVWSNRPVQVRFVTHAEADKLPLRKRPEVDGAYLRLVDIEDFDLNACGGTHVSHTGEVGLVKVIKVTKQKDKLRVEFACGGRALQDYSEKNRVIADLTQALTTGQDALLTSIEKMRGETKETQRALKNQQEALLHYEGQALRDTAEQIGTTTLITYTCDDKEVQALRTLATQLTDVPHTIALLGLAGNQVQLIFKRHEKAPGDMGALLRQTLPLLGDARGGGSATQAQGGGVSADLARVQTAVQQAAQMLRATLGDTSS